jgi:hypothetical protein
MELLLACSPLKIILGRGIKNPFLIPSHYLYIFLPRVKEEIMKIDVRRQ